MKKLLLAFSMLLIAGCSAEKPIVEKTEEPVIDVVQNNEEMELTNTLSILAPKGAPAIATIPFLNIDDSLVTTVDGAELLQAAFVNPNPEYDVIIAPSNLGAMLSSKGKSEYKMLSILTWGNLYVVGESDEALNGKVAAFGEGAVVGLVFEDVLSVNDKTYYNSVADAQAVLLSGEADAALLAEPLATVTINKAKENGKEFKIISDIQVLWKDKYGNNGYPQAAIFVREEAYNENREAYDNLLNIMGDYLASHLTLEEDVDKYGVDVLGVPNGKVASVTYDRMNLNLVKASEAEAELLDFLKLFGIESIDEVILK